MLLGLFKDGVGSYERMEKVSGKRRRTWPAAIDIRK
jgi:hypothetical protein